MQQQAIARGNDRDYGRVANDNMEKRPSGFRSVFPKGAVARIFRPSRSGTTSGKARSKVWHLVFERRNAPFVEPLMGWTGSSDPLSQVRLEFPNLDAAIGYARRQGLEYVVQAGSGQEHKRDREQASQRREFSTALWSRLHLSWLLRGYGYGAGLEDPLSTVADPASVFASPMDVVAEPALTLSEKRAILRNWAWNEYLVDMATAEGMPENDRPSRMDEVELALLALERQAAFPNGPLTGTARRSTV